MATYSSSGATIRGRFASNWTTTDIAYPNVKFSPVQGVAWVLFKIEDARAFQSSLQGSRRALGTVVVEIYVPDGIGDGVARTHADSICNIFRRIQVDGILFREPRAREATSQEAGWYKWMVEIEYQADSNP